MALKEIQLFLLSLLLCISVGYAHPQRGLNNEKQASNVPYQVSIQGDVGHFCGGSIIDERHILTAAHCFRTSLEQGLESFTVLIGTNDRYDRNASNSYKIDRVIVHESYTPGKLYGWKNDIAIVKVNRNITFNEFQQPILLPINETPVGTLVIMTGWGQTGKYPYCWEKTPRYVQRISEKIIGNDECRSRLVTSNIQDGHICALAGEQCGAGLYFSGGPLVDGSFLVGIVSFGRQGAEFPDVYTRVYPYVPWIQKTIAESILDEEYEIDIRK